MNVQDLIADPPRFHTRAGELIADWRLADAELLFLDRHVRSGMKTLETGTGVSTILFALKGSRHTCITPREQEVARVRACCDRRGIPHASRSRSGSARVKAGYLLSSLRRGDLGPFRRAFKRALARGPSNSRRGAGGRA